LKLLHFRYTGVVLQVLLARRD